MLRLDKPVGTSRARILLNYVYLYAIISYIQRYLIAFSVSPGIITLFNHCQILLMQFIMIPYIFFRVKLFFNDCESNKNEYIKLLSIMNI